MWPQVYDLFDDVLLLASGRIVYHGARAGVRDHFRGLGFACPERKATADFLQVPPRPQCRGALGDDDEPPVLSASSSSDWHTERAAQDPQMVAALPGRGM